MRYLKARTVFSTDRSVYYDLLGIDTELSGEEMIGMAKELIETN